MILVMGSDERCPVSNFIGVLFFITREPQPPSFSMFPRKPFGFMLSTFPIPPDHSGTASTYWTCLCLVFSCSVTVNMGLATFSDHFGLQTNTMQFLPLARLRHRVGLCTRNGWHAWHVELSVTTCAVTRSLWEISGCSKYFKCHYCWIYCEM